MIRRIEYQDIDFGKYSLCLETSCQNADYARKEFLDIVTSRQWDVLVFGDYQSVMPVPVVNKFGIKLVVMPKLCQQLGIFSPEKDVRLNDSFYHYLLKNYIVRFYAFNRENDFSFNLEEKTSYEIPKNDYQTVKKNYSVHRRRNVRIIGDLVEHLEFGTDLKEDSVDFFYDNAKGLSGEKKLRAYYDLMKKLLDAGLGTLVEMRFKKEIQSMVFLYKTNKNAYLSLFVNKTKPINTNFASIIIDKCLQDNIAEKNFDFMGSVVKNVAQFNARFGAQAYNYQVISNSKLSLLKNILKIMF